MYSDVALRGIQQIRYERHTYIKKRTYAKIIFQDTICILDTRLKGGNNNASRELPLSI